MRALFYIVLLLCFCCADTTKINSEGNTSSKSKTPEISAKAIENLTFNDYRLSPDAKKTVGQWNKYQELATQIQYLRGADMTFFTTEKDTLKVFFDSLKSSMPSRIDTDPINSRLSVLENTTLKLNNDLALGNYPSAKKLKSIESLLIAHSDLIFFINKKLEFDSNDVARPEEDNIIVNDSL